MITIRYKINKEEVLMMRISTDSTIGNLLSQINSRNSCNKYKYVYSKDSGTILSDDDIIFDALLQEDTIFYILEQREFDINQFEDKTSDESSSKEEETSSEGHEGTGEEEGTTGEGHKDTNEEEGTSDKGHKNANEEEGTSSKDQKKNQGKKIEGDPDIKIGKEMRLDSLLQTQLMKTMKIKVRDADQHTFDKDEFLIFSTQSYETMTNPTKIKLLPDSTYEVVEEIIRKALNIPDKLQLHIYLSTGVLFYKKYRGEENILSNFFSENDILDSFYTNHHIYVIVTEPISQEILDKEFDEVCSVKDNTMKLLMSPICGSTDIGYSRMACLLGTFFYKGVRTTDFIKSVARCTGFAPLISCLISLYYREQIPKAPITGLTIATITASLHALFAKLLPSDTEPEKVFDRCLECSCYVVHIEEAYIKEKKNKRINEEQLRIEKYDLVDDVSDNVGKYLINCGQKNCSFYPYLPDIEEENEVNLALLDKVISFNQIQDIFNQYRSYYPIPPLEIVGISITCIMRYINDQTLLFINTISNDEGPSKVNVINPFVGEIETLDIKEIAKEVSENSKGSLELLIDPEDVEELNVILLDISGSMYSDLETRKPSKSDKSRFSSAKKCIKTFLRMSFLYRLPNLFGFMTFNDIYDMPCEFSPLSAKIEETLVGPSVVCRGSSRIWDALNNAIDRLNDAKENKKTEKARLRIIVFSDGINSGSEKTKEEVCKRAIQNKVIVDSIVLIDDDSCKDLCNFSVFTGGYSYRSENINKLLSFFEKESFLSLKIRGDRSPAEINELDHLFSTKNPDFDTDIENLEWEKQSEFHQICTPNYLMYTAIKKKVKMHRYQLRLYREMKIFSQKDDENIKLYIKSGEITSWKVYIKGPNESYYKDKWWLLTIKFTKDYPLQPPVFRFIDPPYHINVSEDGRVCASFLLSNYNAAYSIYDLVVNIRNLLEEPDENYAIQEYKLNLWKTDRDQFYKNAEVSYKEAEDTLEACIKCYGINDKKDYKVDDNAFEDDNDDFLISISQSYVSKNKKYHDTDHDDDDMDS